MGWDRKRRGATTGGVKRARTGRVSPSSRMCERPQRERGLACDETGRARLGLVDVQHVLAGASRGVGVAVVVAVVVAVGRGRGRGRGRRRRGRVVVVVVVVEDVVFFSSPSVFFFFPRPFPPRASAPRAGANFASASRAMASRTAVGSASSSSRVFAFAYRPPPRDEGRRFLPPSSSEKTRSSCVIIHPPRGRVSPRTWVGEAIGQSTSYRSNVEREARVKSDDVKSPQGTTINTRTGSYGEQSHLALRFVRGGGGDVVARLSPMALEPARYRPKHRGLEAEARGVGAAAAAAGRDGGVGGVRRTTRPDEGSSIRSPTRDDANGNGDE